MSSRKYRGRAERGARSDPAAASAIWLYGQHTVRAALANPRRVVRRILLASDLRANLNVAEGAPVPELADRRGIAEFLPRDAVHQGIAALVAPLPPTALDAVIAEALAARAARRPVLVALDQVTDPRNVGAVLRSAAAFDAAALILPKRNAPPESGALAKAASGALERVPMVRVTNLARAMKEIAKAGFWCVGLDAAGRRSLAEVAPDGPTALVLGGEGRGLRRLTRETCDEMARLPIGGTVSSLNVSAAAAIALYELRRA